MNAEFTYPWTLETLAGEVLGSGACDTWTAAYCAGNALRETLGVGPGTVVSIATILGKTPDTVRPAR